jgi:hypothetical protein
MLEVRQMPIASALFLPLLPHLVYQISDEELMVGRKGCRRSGHRRHLADGDQVAELRGAKNT